MQNIQPLIVYVINKICYNVDIFFTFKGGTNMNFARRGKQEIAINRKMFEKLAEAGATVTSFRDVYGEDTLKKFCKLTYGLDEMSAVRQFAQKGKDKLKLAQYETAVEKRNPVMLIWMGKQMLGQSDDPAKNKIEQERNQTIRDVIDAVKNVN